MPTKLEIMQELNRRGKLPPDKKALLDEATKRGLTTGQAPKPPQVSPGRSSSNNNPLIPGMGGKPEIQPTMGQELSDLWKSAAIGIPQIATDIGGIPRMLQEAPGALIRYAAHPLDAEARNKMWEGEQEFERKRANTSRAILGFDPGARAPSGEELQSLAEKATGEWYKPKYGMGRFGNNIVRNVGGALVAGPEKLAVDVGPKILSGIGAGAASQAAYESSEAGASPWMQIPATILGSLLGHRAGTIPQRYFPGSIAAKEINKVAQEAGATPGNIGARMQAGTQGPGGVEGYSLADALGPQGQALMAQSAEGASPAAQDATRLAMENKAAGAPGRVQGVLEELAGGSQSAKAFGEAGTAMRQAKANMDFDNIRANAGSVDPTSTVDYLRSTIDPQNATMPNSIDQQLEGIWKKLTKETSKPTKGGGTLTITSMTDDWEKAAGVRQDIADMISKAYSDNDKVRVRALSGVRDELDKNLESASPGYTKVMSDQKELHDIINQVEEGKKLSAPSTRTEDVERHFQGLTPEQQNAFRVGFFNKPIAAAQGIEGKVPATIGGPRFGANAKVVGTGNADLEAQLRVESGLAETNKKFERAVARSEVPGGSRPSDMTTMDYASTLLPGGAMSASAYYALQHAGNNPGLLGLLVGAPLAAAGFKKLAKRGSEKAMPKILEQLNYASPEEAAKILRKARAQGYKAPASQVLAKGGILGALAGDRANR